MTELIHSDLTYQIIGAAMEVHKVLGHGFLEAVYESALACELDLRGIPYERQKRLTVMYKGQEVGTYAADFAVDEKVIVELKGDEGADGDRRGPTAQLPESHRPPRWAAAELWHTIPATQTPGPLNPTICVICVIRVIRGLSLAALMLRVLLKGKRHESNRPETPGCSGAAYCGCPATRSNLSLWVARLRATAPG